MRLNRRTRWAALAFIVALMVAGVCLIAFLPSGGGYKPRSLPVRAPSTTPAAPAKASPGVTPAVFARSMPTEIKIPAIGVDARIVPVYDPCISTANCPLDLTPLGQTQNLAGWWDGIPGNAQQSYSPGQAGPAVIVGHVNWAGVGPLVFANLDKLVQGDQIQVVLQSGQTVQFVVSFTQDVYKTAFPTAAVYGPTPYPSLRLVTCTGTLLSTGHYDHNEIVYATEQ